jgi:phospholipase C
VKASTIDTNLSMTAGAHRVTVQAMNSAGQVFNKTVNITVTTGTTTGLDNLKHIIFYVQENRPMDQYFGRFGAYRQSHGFTDPFDSLPLSASLPDYSGTANVSPFHFQTVCIENLSPGWNESHYDYDGGAMDRFMKTSHSVPSTIDPQGTRAMGYYDQTELNYYYALALAYATSDRWFSAVLAPTIPNRMYLFAATSFGHIRPDSAPSGGWTQPTIFRSLQNAGITWKYYYQDNSVFLAQWSDWSTLQSHVVNISNYYTDLTNGTLPQVVFIERASQTGLDEHPGGVSLEKGAANTKKIIDALMHSSAWGSSAFILAFDEGGGFYDHVKPQPAVLPDNIAPMLRSTDIKATFNQTGFRVPVVVISPWVKQHFVSHVVRDNTAILKLIETRFGLTALTARDAAQDDMEEFFDFVNPPRLTLPSLPAQNTSSTCSTSKEKAPGF